MYRILKSIGKEDTKAKVLKEKIARYRTKKDI